MSWKEISEEKDIDTIVSSSQSKPQLIFKHSTRCSISSVVKNRLEKDLVNDKIDFHYLDLIRYRNISNLVAERFNVYHESPQVLLIKNGDCVYDESHYSIQTDEIFENI